eukprot:CAMPEP_0197606352 /NCGR_PEP_ID=MMETSP1326-20131121/44888_1 /TAXON_ID=1155430 /ORGANISM="Genus nov. species nov., Strain RCC2288" /LENGTH=44 /DNA_ID= /DNA_START= /DNA_END= /DNA_ORIENTATION=
MDSAASRRDSAAAALALEVTAASCASRSANVRSSSRRLSRSISA